MQGRIVAAADRLDEPFADTGPGENRLCQNGTGQKPEDNRDKKYALAVPVKVGDLKVEPYVDYETAFGSKDRATYKIFAGYEFRRVTVGIEAVDRVNHRTSGPNQEPRGYSFFVRGTPTPTIA